MKLILSIIFYIYIYIYIDTHTGTLHETGPSTLEAYRQQWPHEDPWELPNPLVDHHDSYYDNHDPDADIDEEWFQGRDEWN